MLLLFITLAISQPAPELVAGDYRVKHGYGGDYNTRIDRGQLVMRGNDWTGVGTKQRGGIYTVTWVRNSGDYPPLYSVYRITNPRRIDGYEIFEAGVQDQTFELIEPMAVK